MGFFLAFSGTKPEVSKLGLCKTLTDVKSRERGGFNHNITPNMQCGIWKDSPLPGPASSSRDAMS